MQASFYDAISDAWLSSYYTFPSFILLAILYLFIAKKNRSYIEYFVFFLAMCVQLYASSMGHHFGHYKLSFIPYFCYGIFFVLKHFDKRVIEEHPKVLACAAFFLFVVPMPILIKYNNIINKKYWSYYTQRSECYDRVKDIEGKDGQLFVLNDPGYLALNTDLKSVSHSKLTYFHFYGNAKFDEDNSMFYEMVETLQKNRCKYIIDFTIKKPIARQELQEYWNGFVDSNYHQIYDHVGYYRIMQIN